MPPDDNQQKGDVMGRPANDPNQFYQSALIALEDIGLQTALDRGAVRANVAREASMNQTTDRARLREQAQAARLRGLHDLPELLEQVEAHISAQGGTVLWALDADEANRHVLDICRRHDLRRGVKAKSMVTEEIELVPFLEAHDIRMIETDLGEYVVQLSGDRPSHITMPIMHHTKESVRDILMQQAGMPHADTPEQMTAFAREALRGEYIAADFGISGGNFIIAETGHIVTVTNEGNGRLCTGLPPVHIAVVGIEKVIPTWEDFLTLYQLLCRSASGQQMSVYMNAVRSPARTDENDGPEHLYLILVDNGRSDIYGSEYAEALACIRCGACLNTCPVYQNVGGHAYGGVYPGPIGAVLTPLFKGKANAVPLPFASSLCGACQTACPVNINIPDMLLKLRHDLQDEQELIWQGAMTGFGYTFSHPLLYRTAGFIARTAGSVCDRTTGSVCDRTAGSGHDSIGKLPPPFDGWTESRDFPPFAAQPFRDWWKQNRERKK